MTWTTTTTATGATYDLALLDGTVTARNAKGKVLAAVPAPVKKTDEYAALQRLQAFLAAHDAEAGETVERWLRRGLPVPTAVVVGVWPDEAWRSWLQDLVVTTDDGTTGFLRSAGPDGLGLVDLDGETVQVTPERVLFPHPALLPDLDDLRELAAGMGLTQRLDQLFRTVHRRPAQGHGAGVTALEDWADARYEQLRFATGRALAGGATMSGGYATTTTFEDGRRITAQIWVGEGDPSAETEVSDLRWVDEQGRPLTVDAVPPVAYSEGVRLAVALHAGRSVESPEGN